MPRIRALPANVVTQIAAGEVIERPASVVKELVENSLDAGATRIAIELESGGTERICVVDDGHGIHADDLPLAVASHATSKLQSADDLFRIATNGFRGEALASIAGIAKLTLQSRTAEGDGAELKCDGGELSPIRPWGGAVGTRIEVRHLFFNVPARKKFLKSIATELRTASETVTRLALSHPEVGFTLTHNQRTVIDIPKATSLPDRIALFFGGEVAQALLPVDSGDREPRIHGYVCDPKIDRGNSQLQYLFVNGRWFRDRSLGHAFTDAYRGLILTGRYPIGFLFLTVPPDQVDVNVHPTKSEVRFRDQSAIYSLVRGAVKTKLLSENLIPSVPVPQGTAVEWTPREPIQPLASPVAADPSLPFSFAIPAPARTPSLVESIEFPPPPPRPLPEAPVVAAKPPEPLPNPTAFQLHDAYIVLETADGMLVIDQHALHERILFEQLRQRIRDGKLEIQRLLVPEPIELPPVQFAAVLEAKAELLELGLDVSEFGGNTVILNSYPSLLGRKSPRAILLAVVDELTTKERAPAKEQLLHLLMATMACKAAVKAGDPLAPDEIQNLLALRAFAEDSHHCPHGRPTSLLFRRSELDRQFKRT
jgi:DNA mismatch repair protein MutL